MDQAHGPWTEMPSSPRWITATGNGRSSSELTRVAVLGVKPCREGS
jgi:hypothetical protein